MAKYERKLLGNFDHLLDLIDASILNDSSSASFEGGSDYSSHGVRCAVRVYERYSILGSNRVSLSVTLIGDGDALFLTGITSGGSQAILFKVNTWGGKAFLECLQVIVEHYVAERG